MGYHNGSSFSVETSIEVVFVVRLVVYVWNESHIAVQKKPVRPIHNIDRPDFSRISSFPSPLVSSCEQKWTGILVEQRRLNPGIVQVPALSEHFLGLHLRQPDPVQFIQHRERTTRQALFREGDVTLLPAGQACLWQHESGYADVLQIRLQPTLLQTVAEAIHLPPESLEVRDVFVFQDPQIYEIGSALLRELQSPGLGGRLFVESLATILSLQLLRQYCMSVSPARLDKATLPSARVQRVIEYIHEHLGSDLSLFALAEVAQLSPYHLLRLFKQATGQTPYHYLLTARLQRAQDMLRHTDAPISEVALLTGFADQSHLTRHFKRAFGITPALFVREQRQ